jgi:hypothetical protein
MQRRTRHVIAVMVVATALCADRTVSAASQVRTPRAQPRSLASRITTSFRQTVAPVRLQPARTGEEAKSLPLPIRQAAGGVRDEYAPFQFRLPPPQAR